MPQASLKTPPPQAWWSTVVADYPRALAWSAAGDFLAIGTAAGDISIHAAEDGTVARRLPAHDGGILALAWHPQHHCLVSSGEDGAVHLWDLARNDTTRLVAAGAPWSEHLLWQPQGTALAMAASRRMYVWDEAGQQVAVSAPLESTISGLQWSPDGAQVATACYGGVRLFRREDAAHVRSFDWKGSMLNLAWSPNGAVLACGCQDNALHFWRLPGGQDAMMSGFPHKPRSISWSHDSLYLVTSGAREVLIWTFDKRGPEGQAPMQLRGHLAPLTAVAFAPIIHLLATGDKAGVLHFWAPDKRSKPLWQMRLNGAIEHLSWGLYRRQPNLLLAAADERGTVRVWPLD